MLVLSIASFVIITLAQCEHTLLVVVPCAPTTNSRRARLPASNRLILYGA